MTAKETLNTSMKETPFEKYFEPQYIVETKEISYKEYKLIIHTYDTTKLSGSNTWKYTQGLLFKGDLRIGSIKRNYSHFPYFFFEKKNKTYFISGSSYMSQTIIDCENGNVYESKDQSSFIWTNYIPIDENTLCVCGCYWGGPYQYEFFDMTDPSKGWPLLQLDESIPKYYYILMDHDVIGQNNCSKPIIEGDKIIFHRRQARVKDGDVDMEEQEYKYAKYYEDHNLASIRQKKDYQDMIYYHPMSKLVLKREGDIMKLVEFWRSQYQIEEDEFDESNE